MSIQDEENPSCLSRSSLCCREEIVYKGKITRNREFGRSLACRLILSPDQDLFREDIELRHLLSKEREQQKTLPGGGSSGSLSRGDAVYWILRASAYHGFKALTAILAINYVDRFLSTSLGFERENKPWMVQLLAVSSLSLAAKVEETQVPLLLDLQVEETRYVFEARTIQRMELLVLSTLQWRMNPVTPISFLDYIIGRLGLKPDLLRDFLNRCESLLVSVISDSRSVRYLPSALAAASMMRVTEQVDHLDQSDIQNKLFGIFKTSKEELRPCYKLVAELSMNYTKFRINRNKRKHRDDSTPSSPSGVIDAETFSGDWSNYSWSFAGCSSMHSSSSSSSSLPSKKSRAQQSR